MSRFKLKVFGFLSPGGAVHKAETPGDIPLYTAEPAGEDDPTLLMVRPVSTPECVDPGYRPAFFYSPSAAARYSAGLLCSSEVLRLPVVSIFGGEYIPLHGIPVIAATQEDKDKDFMLARTAKLRKILADNGITDEDFSALGYYRADNEGA